MFIKKLLYARYLLFLALSFRLYLHRSIGKLYFFQIATNILLIFYDSQSPEPVFVNRLRSPGIDTQPDGPVRQPYLSYRPAMLHRQEESNPRHRSLVSLNVYKYGLSLVSLPETFQILADVLQPA
jgi:hypothetical protein